MLVLVILRTNTSVLFVFNVRLHIIPGVTLVEAGAGLDSGSCMPPRLRNAVQHFQSN